ncbi:MAG: hypothetical protein GX565_06990 [Lentisphaerae bacterium]|nr:hypothetical protein [Lentisphaerota bacterium]
MEAVAPKPRPILSQEDAQRLDQERAAFVEIYQNYLAKKEDAIPGSRHSASLESAAAGAQRSPWQAKVPKPIRSAVPPETMMGLVQGTLDLLHATDTRSAEEIAAVDQAIKALTVKGAPDAAFFSSLPQRIQQLSAAMDTLAIRYAANNPFEFGEDRSRIALTLSFAKELHAAKQSILAAFDAVKLDPAKRAAAYGAANLGSLGPLLDAASAEGAEVATAALVDALEAERRDLDESFPQMSAVERQKLLERTSPVLRVFFWNLARFVPKEQDHSALILRAIASHPNWFGGANRDGESVFSSPEELRRFLGMPGTEGEKRAFATPRNSDFAGKALWMAMRHMPVSAAREVGRYLRSIVAPKVDISTGLATASGATAARLHARRAADGSIQVTGEIGVDRSVDLAGSRFIKRVSDSILNTVFSGSSTDREELDAALSTAAATFDGNQRQGYASTFRKLMAVLSPENTGLWALASDSLKDADYGAMGPQADQRIRDFVAAIRLALRTAPSPGRANEIGKRVRAAVSGLYNSVFSLAIVPNDEWQQTPLVDSQNHKPSYRLRSFLDTVFSPNEITRLSGITIDLERLRSDFSPEVVQSFTFDDADSDAVVRTMLQEALARRFLADEGKTRLGVVIPGGGKSDISVVWLEPSAVLRDSGAAKLGGDWETVATQGLTAALVRMGFPEAKGLDTANAESLAAIEGIIRKRGEKFSSPGLAFDPWATYLHDAHDGTFPITRVGKLKTFVIIGRADMRGADGQTLPLELLKGAALPTRNGRAALEAAGYGQVSWDIKAHMWGRRGDSAVHMKPVFAHPDSVPEAADLLDAADRAGYRVVADTDCTKLPNYKRIPAAERVRLSVGDVVYEGFELEIEPQNLLEVAFLDASSVTRPRTLPATLSYDRITAGSDRETTPNAFFRIIERAVKRVKGLKDSMLGRRITPHQESQRAHIIGRENISYPPVARTLRDLHNAVLREQTDVSGVGTFAVQVPSGGIVLKDPVFNSAGVQTHAAGDVFWPFGEDTALRYYEKRNGRLISQGVRLNIRGNGVRRSRRLVFSDSTSRKAFLDELQSKPFTEGVALLRARGDFSEAVSLNDLWRGRDNDLDIEDGFRLEGDTTLVVRGTAVMLYRTPGGHPIYPYARARIEDWVSPDPKDPEQAGRTAEVKFHPQHVANGGSDMDGDQVTVHIEANAWDGAQWVTPDIRDETEGEFAMSNQLFRVLWDSYENPDLLGPEQDSLDGSVITQGINPRLFEDLLVPHKDRWVRASEIEQEAVNPLSPSGVARLVGEARNSANNRAGVIYYYATFRRVFENLGATVDHVWNHKLGEHEQLPLEFVRPDGSKGAVVLYRPATTDAVQIRTRQASDRVFGKALGDLVTMVLDKPFELSAMGFDSITLPLYVVAGALRSQGYASEKDVQAFTQDFIYWVNSPVMLRYRKSVAARAKSALQPGAEDTSVKQLARKEVEDSLQTAEDRLNWARFRALESIVYRASGLNHVLALLKNPVRSEDDALEAEAALREKDWRLGGSLHLPSVNSAQFRAASAKVNAVLRSEYPLRASIYRSPASVEALSRAALRRVPWLAGRDIFSKYSSATVATWLPRSFRDRVRRARIEPAALAEVLAARLGRSLQSAAEATVTALSEPGVRADAATTETAIRLRDSGTLDAGHIVRKDSPFVDHDWIRQLAVRVVGELREYIPHNAWVRNLDVNRRRGIISAPSAVMGLTGPTYAKIAADFDNLESFLPGGSYRMPVAYTEIDAAGKSTEVNLWLTLSADQIRDIVALYAVTRTYPEYSLLHLMSAGYNNALDRDVLAELQGGLWARTETPEFSAFVDYLDAQLDDDVLDRPYVPFVSVAPYLRAQPTALPVWALGERGPNAAELVASSGGVLAPREAEEATAEVDTRPLPVPPETRQAKVVSPVREPEPMDAPEMPVLLDSITAGAPISPSDSARPGSYRAIVPGFLSQAAQAAGTLELFLQNRAKSGFPTAVLVNADRTLSVGDRVLVGTQPAEVVEVRPYDNTQADEGRESALKEASGIDVGSLRLLADTAEGPRARAWLGLSASRKWQAVTVVLQTSVLADGALAYEAARKPGVPLKPVLQTQRGNREAALPSQKVVSASAQQQRLRLSAEVPALLPPGDAIAIEQALADVPAGSDEAVIEILTKLLSDKDVASAIQALASVGADPRAVAAGNLSAAFKGEAPKDAGLIAVTTAIKTLLPHPEGMLGQVFGFDDIKVSQEQAERRLKKQGVRNPSQAEIDTLAQAIRDDWALTAKAGDAFHRVVQAVLAHKEAPAGASQDLLRLLSDYKTSKNTAFLEQDVWGLGFSGRVDRIDVLADGSLVLYDYKTTNTDSDPHGSGTKFSRSYISGQDNSKYQSAKLQLYIYRRILETKGFRVKGAFVVPSVRTADGSVQLWKNTQGDYLLEANPDDMTLAYARRISEVSAHKGLAESQPQGAGANQASSASLESAEAGAARGYSGSFLFNTVGGSEPDRLQREIVKRFNEEHAAHVAANQIVNLIGRRQGAVKGQIFNEAGRKVGTLTPEQQDAAKVFGAVELALWSAEIYQTDSSGRRVRAVGQSLLDVILKPNFTKAKAEEWAKTHNLVIEDLVVPLGRPVTVGKTTLPANPTIAQALAAVEATGYADAIQSKGGYALSIWNDLNTLGAAARKLGLDSRHLLSRQQGLGVATQDLESAVDAVKKAGQKFPWWRVAAGDTLFAGVAEGALVTEFGGEHRDRVVDRAVLAAQLDILKSITGQDLAVSDTAKLGLTFTDVNRMIASGLEQRLVRAVHADRDYVNTEAGKLDLRTRAVLRRVLAYYDARGIAENIPWIPGVTGSLAELAASGTWAPAFSSAISQFKHAVMRRAAQAKSDALLYEFTQTLTPSGDPAIIVLPLAEAVHPANQDNPHPGAATTELMDMQALNLVKVLTRQHKPAVYDLAAPAAERARQFAVLVSTYTSGSQSYKSVRTHALRGVAAVWARDEVSWQVAHWLKDRMRWAIGTVDYLRLLRGLAAWMKSAVVTGSAFFFVSGFEGVVAATHLLDSLRTSELKGGGTPRQLLKDRAKGFFKMPSHLLKADEDVRDLFEDAAASGIMMEGDNAFDENISVIDRGLDTLRDWVRRNYGKKQADRADFFMRRIVRMQGLTDRYFGRAGERVGVFQNFKFYILMHTAEHVAAQGYGVNFNALDREGRRKIFREIAPFINNAAGGQNWAQYWWATPNTRALLNLLFFAPNWTVSAWNVAGGGLLTGKIMGNDMGETERALVLANTMMMASVVLVGAPAALQAAIYAACGDPDEGDVPLPWMNEPGRKLHIDITPLIRKMPGYTGGATGRRRVFMQFGKQALEVYDGWMTDVLKNATAKLSMPVKLVLEQALGRSPGSDWNLEFNGLGAAGWAYGLDEKGRRSFLRGRLGYIAQKALPMSVTSALLRPETLATTWIAPTSLGTSERKAVDACVAVLNSLAERDSWNEFRSHPVVRGNALKYVSNILHAAERNGYDGKRILQSAKSTVLTRLYRNFWGALDAGDFTDMEDYARAILRVGGTVKGATDSINRRRGLKDEPLSDVDKAAIDAAFAVSEPVKRQ